MPDSTERATEPEDITRLFVERANAGDAAGMAALYAQDAVLGYPPREVTVGRDAIRQLFGKMLAQAPRFQPEEPLPTLRYGDVALTGTPARDVAGSRSQVVARQPDGSWVRIIDRPEPRS